MNAREAVAAAKTYIKGIYADEKVTKLGLEEVECDNLNKNWLITIGFSRAWNTLRSSGFTSFADPVTAEPDAGITAKQRSYKVIKIDFEGNVISMKNRFSENFSE